jgi:diadenosine tetraphosphatase ApaH/serine/threonine PP2A family protein phosphatase
VRAAVVSDIHANLHALEAVLAAVEAEAPDEVWFLGDLIGYGPRPNRCRALLQPVASISLVGNHDLGTLDRISLDLFAPEAATSARWTRTVLEPETEAFLNALEAAGERAGVGLFHGSPRDPVWEYVLSPEAALTSLLAVENRLVLVGHSHVPLAISFDGELLNGGVAEGGSEVQLDEKRWLLNPGSVGQPRDGDPRAAWLLLDLDESKASFRRVEYPVEETQREIRDRGLPELLAARLEHGL